MKLECVFQAFYIIYESQINKTEITVLDELKKIISNKIYTNDLKLDKISFDFINIGNFKCRTRPYYLAVRDMDKDSPSGPYSLMALVYEIPLLESEFVKVSEEELPTYIGKILLEHLETHDVPTKIRKQFDRERFISDVRDFFVHVKGCKL